MTERSFLTGSVLQVPTEIRRPQGRGPERHGSQYNATRYIIYSLVGLLVLLLVCLILKAVPTRVASADSDTMLLQSVHLLSSPPVALMPWLAQPVHLFWYSYSSFSSSSFAGGTISSVCHLT